MKTKTVDAARIRNTIETDFSGWGTKKDYPFIPAGEVWIDKYLINETGLILSLISLERKNNSKSFSAIRKLAREKFIQTTDAPFIIRTQKQDKNFIRFVDGAIIRQSIDPYFLLGGHELVYEYIPKNEIWIDTRSDPKDWKYTLIHELDERKRMKKGMSYDDAHDFALATERSVRRKDMVANFIRG